MSGGEISSVKYQGHRGPVLCLDVSGDGNERHSDGPTGTPSSAPPHSSSSSSLLLLSGSEDRTARVWDLRDHRRRACLCIQAPGEVLAASFAPPHRPPQQQRQPAPPSGPADAPPVAPPPPPPPLLGFARDFTVYLGVENTVLEYDLRRATATPILLEPARNLGPVLQNQDEVNQISLAYGCCQAGNTNSNAKPGKRGGKGGSKRHQQPKATAGAGLYLAACDDAGTVRFMEATGAATAATPGPPSAAAASSQILHHDCNGVAVVPACAFRPSMAGRLELVSGGTDCKIHLWDICKPRKPLSSFTVSSADRIGDPKGDTCKPQVCNPPMVHSLAWSPSGASLAAGLGDGSIGIFAVENRTLVQTRLLSTEYGASHDASVASVVFPSFSPGSAERVLCSAGSDGSIFFWDLPHDGDVGGFGSSGDRGDQHCPTNLFASTLLKQHGDEDNTSATTASNLGRPRILFGIPHGQKMNWVTTAVNNSSTSGRHRETLFVADTSADITAYTIPLRS